MTTVDARASRRCSALVARLDVAARRACGPTGVANDPVMYSPSGKKCRNAEFPARGGATPPPLSSREGESHGVRAVQSDVQACPMSPSAYATRCSPARPPTRSRDQGIAGRTRTAIGPARPRVFRGFARTALAEVPRLLEPRAIGIWVRLAQRGGCVDDCWEWGAQLARCDPVIETDGSTVERCVLGGRSGCRCCVFAQWVADPGIYWIDDFSARSEYLGPGVATGWSVAPRQLEFRRCVQPPLWFSWQ